MLYGMARSSVLRAIFGRGAYRPPPDALTLARRVALRWHGAVATTLVARLEVARRVPLTMGLCAHTRAWRPRLLRRDLTLAIAQPVAPASEGEEAEADANVERLFSGPVFGSEEDRLAVDHGNQLEGWSPTRCYESASHGPNLDKHGTRPSRLTTSRFRSAASNAACGTKFCPSPSLVVVRFGGRPHPFVGPSFPTR